MFNKDYDFRELSGIITRVFGSQRGFARALGKSESYVSEVLRGNRILRATEIDKWASTLGVPETDIGRVFFTHKVHETATI